MQKTVWGGILLFSGMVAGCATHGVNLSPELGGYRQERVVYACESDLLCGAQRLYDVNWLRCSDFPVDSRAGVVEFTPARTQYIYRENLLDPASQHSTGGQP